MSVDMVYYTMLRFLVVALFVMIFVATTSASTFSSAFVILPHNINVRIMLQWNNRQPQQQQQQQQQVHRNFETLSLLSFIGTQNDQRIFHHHHVVRLPQQRRRTLLLLSSSSPAIEADVDAAVTKADSINNNNNNNNNERSTTTSTTSWFPTRIQDSLHYENVVQRLYLRHIVTETLDMARIAQQQSTQPQQHFEPTTTDAATMQQQQQHAIDPFGSTAKLLSACTSTRLDGGKIGWVERNNDTVVSTTTIISHQVLQNLFQLQPKAGDVHIVQDVMNQKWHVIQIVELWMKDIIIASSSEHHSTTTTSNPSETTGTRVGYYEGSNMNVPRRRKLKGYGVLPEFPQELTTYTIQTAGCQMNVADSERIAGILQNNMQMTVATNPTQADLVLFNTCSIRDHAEQKLYDALGPYAIAKRKKGHKRMALVVTGCVAQQEGYALLKRIPEIDVVLGPQYIPHLQTVLEHVANGHQFVATAPMLLQEHNNNNNIMGDRDPTMGNNNMGWFNKPIRGHDVRAWVNVIHGCNEHCTYCVVPATRGMEQSRTMESILSECLYLASQGYREVTLLGQNIDAYGRDMIPKRTFATLLEYLNTNLPNKMRIRYVTSHPRYFSDRVIDAVADLDKVCECFHVPFQAGDDEVLRNMRRGYTYDSYMKIIHKIRQKSPDAAICTDIIVGFPGETEDAFQKTLQLMEEVKFDNVNSFAYSPRPNTEAALWTNQIDDDVKSERLQLVQQLATKHGMERSERYLGRTVEVLVEDANPRDPLQVMGRTRQGRQVYFTGDLSTLRGEFVNVKITEARTWSLKGELEASSSGR